MQVKAFPIEDRTNGWSAILPPRQPKPALAKHVRADWLVIGAGYAGLATARRLAENNPDQTVVIVDADIVGENASGRNSGFAIDVPHNVGSSTAELELAGNYRRLMKAGIDHLEDLVLKNGIDCQWSRAGKYHCAVSPKTADTMLEHHARELMAMNEPFEVLDKAALTRRIGSPYFHAGIYTPGGALLNPAALSRGLADSLPKNVSLYEQTPVLELEVDSTVRARTGQGSVTAARVVIANNVFASQFGVLKNKIFPLVSFASLTDPLTPEQQERLGASDDQWGLTPANAFVGATMRYTKDKRILIRQWFDVPFGGRVSDATRRNTRVRHKKVFDARFPMLPEVEMRNFWQGTIALTRNGAPGWGQVSDRVFVAAGCNGVGVVKQTIAGTLLADLASKRDNPLIADMKALGEPSNVPPNPWLTLGAKAYMYRENWVGRGEY